MQHRGVDPGHPESVDPGHPESVDPGHPEAFDLTEAYDAHGSALFGFAVTALRDRGLAEDCVQETFLRAWRARATFAPGRGSLRTWLFAIERNVVIDVQRARARLPTLVGADVLDGVAGETDDPLQGLEIAEALATLSDEHRQVLVALHLDGQSYGDIERSTGVPAATLRTRAYYALRAVRKNLDDQKGRDD